MYIFDPQMFSLISGEKLLFLNLLAAEKVARRMSTCAGYVVYSIWCLDFYCMADLEFMEIA